MMKTFSKGHAYPAFMTSAANSLVRWSVLLSIVITSLINTADAEAQTMRIDFENSTTPTSPNTPIVFDNQEGLSITISGVGLRVMDLLEFGGDPKITGMALISWSWSQGDTGGITIDFSRPVSSLTLSAGDFGGDNDGPLRLRGYDCQGEVVTESSADWPEGMMPPFVRFTVQAEELCRVVYLSSGSSPNSTFIDDIVVD